MTDFVAKMSLRELIMSLITKEHALTLLKIYLGATWNGLIITSYQKMKDKKRRKEIASIIERTNTWLAKIPQSIKAVDVVMNDGIQKMAEATAGKPFQIGVFVNQKSDYTMAKPGIINVNVKASGKEGIKTKLGFHHQSERFRIETTGKAFFDETNLSEDEFDLMDINLKLNAQECKQRDVISFTIIVSEMKDGIEFDRRGLSTVIHIV